MNKTQEALKLALEALKRLHYEMYTMQGEQAITAIREALAEQPAQPIRWDSAAVDMTGAMATIPKTGSESVVDYKPVISDVGADANIAGIPGSYYGIVPKGTGKITVTSPPASKPWVGLSTDEIYDMYNEPRSDAEMVEFARAIEAKLKEKNNG